jgi:hypothetical protein
MPQDRTAAPTQGGHTPGPWIWDGHTLSPGFPNPDGSAIHTILAAEFIGWGYFDSDPERTNAESHQNQAVIAAAPDLFAALEIAEAFMSGFEDDEAKVGMEIKLAIMRSALAKARGMNP